MSASNRSRFISHSSVVVHPHCVPRALCSDLLSGGELVALSRTFFHRRTETHPGSQMVTTEPILGHNFPYTCVSIDPVADLRTQS